MRYDLAVFDLDGTLIDSVGDISDAVNRTLSEFDLPSRSEDEIREYLGEGARRLAEQLLVGIDTATVDDVLASFRREYLAFPLERTRPYAGIPELLDALDGRPLALATNKPEQHTLKILDGLGWTSKFDVIIGGDSLAERKPHPLILSTVCERVGVPPARTAHVGDTPYDVHAATSAGVTPIGVSWGFRTADELRAEGAEMVVDSTDELLRALLLGGDRNG